VRSFVVEEGVDDGDEGFGLLDALVKNARAALIKDGALGRLKNDVVTRIALVQLALNFFGEVVLFIFGFPIAVGKVVEVNQCTINDDR